MINGDEGGDQRVENVGRNGRQIWMIGWKIFTARIQADPHPSGVKIATLSSMAAPRARW